MAVDASRQKQVELQEVSPGLAIIIIGPSQLLRRIKWLRLVEVAPMRFLLSIPVGTSISTLELAILELLDEESSDQEHSLLIELRDLIRSRRHGGLLKRGAVVYRHTGHSGRYRRESEKSKGIKARR